MERKNVDGGVVFGNLLFLSGVCMQAKTVEEEIRQSMEKIRERLTAQGAGFKDVLSATVFLRDINDRERILNTIWKEYFPENAPARTCVQAGIGMCRFEVQMIAALPAGR